jgi:epoxyqueuosine reductase
MNPRAAEAMRCLNEAGMQARIVPAKRAKDVGCDVQSLKDDGLLNQELYDLYLSKYCYDAPDSLPTAKSLLIIAVPTTGTILTFHRHGKEHRFRVPPTYANAMGIDRQVRSILQEALPECKMVKAILPLKTLAARTGLAKYGRNNITYIEGLGSFYRLTGFFIDQDMETDDWQTREMMAECAECDLCLRACPTGAINKDRFLIKADRCLTFHNEMPSERAFPAKMRPNIHHAMVGCMRCQEACPKNSGHLDSFVEGDVFSEEETEYLLRGDYQNEDAEEVMEKLDCSGVDLEIFPRNLAILLDRKEDK